MTEETLIRGIKIKNYLDDLKENISNINKTGRVYTGDAGQRRLIPKILIKQIKELIESEIKRMEEELKSL